MNLESPKINLDKSAQQLFDSLSNVKNFEKLMPDTIVKFEAINDNEFVFGLKGMPEITLKIKEKIAPHKIVYSAVNDKLPFTLTANINDLDSKSQIQLLFEGQFNAMMAMMIKGPISKFMETLIGNMNKL
jgi:hypothetical protein